MSSPRHLALIPDGNRRWARRQGRPGPDGHVAGIQAVGPVVAAAWESGVEIVTFWWGSPANLLRRGPEEVGTIVDALHGWMEREGADLLREHQAGFRIEGRWAELCPSLAPAVATAEAAAGPGPRRLVILMGYDGREEILAAAAAAGGDRQRFEAALWTGGLPPVDLVVRTGGEPHLSAGFMLWWIAEAQLHFSPMLWPAFGPQELQAVLTRYSETPRRMGR